MWTTSLGLATTPRHIGNVRRNTMPPRSTKAEPGRDVLDNALVIQPGSISANSFFFISSRWSSSKRRRLTTMFRRASSMTILHSTVFANGRQCPRRMSTCDAGRKTWTPILTRRPPLILRVTRPETTSPSLCFSMTDSHSLPLRLAVAQYDGCRFRLLLRRRRDFDSSPGCGGISWPSPSRHTSSQFNGYFVLIADVHPHHIGGDLADAAGDDSAVAESLFFGRQPVGCSDRRLHRSVPVLTRSQAGRTGGQQITIHHCENGLLMEARPRGREKPRTNHSHR